MCDYLISHGNLWMGMPPRTCGRAPDGESLGGLQLCWQHREKILNDIRTLIQRDHHTRIGFAYDIELGIRRDQVFQQRMRLVVNEIDYKRRQAEREAREAERRKASVVYFVERDGFIKIGFTTQLRKRLSALGKGGQMPEGMTVGPVKLLATLPGDDDNEGYLHRRFRAHRIDGTEWFYPAPELLAFIRRLKDYRGDSFGKAA